MHPDFKVKVFRKYLPNFQIVRDMQTSHSIFQENIAHPKNYGMFYCT